MKYTDIDCVAAERLIRPHVIETPVVRSAWLSDPSRAEVYLKLENQQETGAFKLRGATHKLLSLHADRRRRGVVTASSGGNTRGGRGRDGRKTCGCDRSVRACADRPGNKARIEAFGARVRLVEGAGLLAEQTARREGERTGREYVSPYNDPDVIAGQGTISVELLRQLPRVDAVFVAVGGGGLISGIGAHLKAASPHTQVVACWPENSRAMFECMRADRVLEVEEKPTLSISTAGGVEEGAVTPALSAGSRSTPAGERGGDPGFAARGVP